MKTPPKKKSKWYNQSFNSTWLSDPKFKDWLTQDEKNKDSSFELSFGFKTLRRFGD